MSLLEARGLTVEFTARGGLFGRERSRTRAVDGVDLDVHAGETLALVGESGSGKTTLGRALLRLVEPTAGSVRYQREGGSVDLLGLGARELRALRPELQIVFQDPTAALNPRLPVRELLGEALRVHARVDAGGLEAHMAETLERVGLDRAALDRRPHEFSAGQRQRIAIARALVLEPRFVVCDEPVSALDVSVQAQILNLLSDLQAERGIAYLFIAHDLAVVRVLAHRIAVMRSGKIVEVGEADQVFDDPQHEYTRELLDAIPRL